MASDTENEGVSRPEEDRETTRPAWSRRDFVKTSVVAAAGGAALAAGAMAVSPLSQRGSPPPSSSFRYVAAKVLPGSKAPRGLPLIPVRVNAAGDVEGRPDHLDWYRYCGRTGAPGLEPSFASDNAFRYHVDAKVLATTQAEGIDAWYASKLGRKARAADFTAEGIGAPAVWRSEGHEADYPLTCLLIRVDPSKYEKRYADEFFPDGILGVYATCAHFCLVPTWRASRVGYGAGHWDDITCFGHGSWYSPRDLAEYSFPPTGQGPLFSTPPKA